MFFLIRVIIWLVGLLFLAELALGFFGYGFNTDYFKQNQKTCQEKIVECQKNLRDSGFQEAKETCEIDCVNPKLFIHKAK